MEISKDKEKDYLRLDMVTKSEENILCYLLYVHR